MHKRPRSADSHVVGNEATHMGIDDKVMPTGNEPQLREHRCTYILYIEVQCNWRLFLEAIDCYSFGRMIDLSSL